MNWFSRTRAPWQLTLWLLGALLGCASSAQAKEALSDSTRLQAVLPDTTRLKLLHRLAFELAPHQPELANSYAQRGVALAHRLGKHSVELDIVDILAVNHARVGDLPQALTYYLRGLHHAEALHDTLHLGNALLGVANVQADENNYVQAEATLHRGIGLARGAANVLQLARFQVKMSGLLVELHRYDEAARTAQAALPTLVQLGEQVIYDQADCLLSLADAACGQRRFPVAYRHGQQAAVLMTRLGDTYGQAWACDVLSRAALGLGNLPQARLYGQRAVALARTAGEPGTEEHLLDNLIAAYVGQHDYADAFPLQQRLTHLRDSLFNQTRATEMARLQTQYETDAKQQEIRDLRHCARIQALERDRDHSRLRWLGGGAAALLVALGLFAALSRRLQRSRLALQRSNRTKDQLLSIVGHDLRGPVAAFQQVGGMLRHYARHPDSTELEDLAGELEQGATQLAGLLDNLLHWARSQMGQVVNRPTALPAAAAVRPVLHLYGPAALAKRLTLRADLPLAEDSAAFPVWADAALLDTVLRNLVANAIKFTPAGGEIEVSSRPAAGGRGVEFSVRDTGVGMTPEAAAALFEPAVRPTQGTAGEQGTGLGVAVCRQFVALLGGELRLDTTLGTGTRFWFTLPTAPQVAYA